jgi:hypothetical protein
MFREEPQERRTIQISLFSTCEILETNQFIYITSPSLNTLKISCASETSVTPHTSTHRYNSRTELMSPNCIFTDLEFLLASVYKLLPLNRYTVVDPSLRLKKNSIVCVRERTTPTERPPLVGEVIANFCR